MPVTPNGGSPGATCGKARLLTPCPPPPPSPPPSPPYRQIRGEPRRGSQLVLRSHQQGEALLLRHAGHPGVVGQRHLTHLDHSPAAGKAAPRAQGRQLGDRERRDLAQNGHDLVRPASPGLPPWRGIKWGPEGGGCWVLPPTGSTSPPSPRCSPGTCSPGTQRDGSILPVGRETAPRLWLWLWERGSTQEKECHSPKRHLTMKQLSAFPLPNSSGGWAADFLRAKDKG